MFFVFLSLMEYALVNYAARYDYVHVMLLIPTTLCFDRTDAQRATEKKKRKDKEIELLAMAADNNELEDQDDLKVRSLFKKILYNNVNIGSTFKKS